MSNTTKRSTMALSVIVWLAWVSSMSAQAVPLVVGVQGSYIESIARLEQAVVPVICATTNERDGQLDIGAWIGTAFFVDHTGTFITAAHVVAAVRKQKGPACEPAIYVPIGGWRHGVVHFRISIFLFSECVEHDKSIDVSVCRTDIDLEHDAAGKELLLGSVVFDEDIPPIGTTVTFTGFPLGTRQPITSRGTLAGYGAENGRPDALIVVDKNGWRGLSGGPLYLEDGRVIGIVVQAGFDDGAGLTYALAAAYLAPVVASAKNVMHSTQTSKAPAAQTVTVTSSPARASRSGK